MSIVVAKVFDNRIEFAADSQISGHYLIFPDQGYQKLRRINDIVLGFSGNVEECNYMTYYMKTHLPEGNDELDVIRYLVEFAKFKKELCGDATLRSQYLIAYGGKLFEADGLSVIEIKDFAAIGCGRDFGYVALYLGHSVREAVEVAIKLDPYVGGDITEYTIAR